METQITALYLSGDQIRSLDIFGYASKGLPGIEIIGLGQKGKSIKEKFIYISRIRQLRPPLKKYVLCAELPPQYRDKSSDDTSWLELPLLLLFWFLGQHMTIHSFHDCISSGRVSADGRITLLQGDEIYLQKLLQELQLKGLTGIKYFCHQEALLPKIDNLYPLSLPGSLGHIPGLSFETLLHKTHSNLNLNYKKK